MKLTMALSNDRYVNIKVPVRVQKLSKRENSRIVKGIQPRCE